jgi:hypothetical protein
MASLASIEKQKFSPSPSTPNTISDMEPTKVDIAEEGEIGKKKRATLASTSIEEQELAKAYLTPKTMLDEKKEEKTEVVIEAVAKIGAQKQNLSPPH